MLGASTRRTCVGADSGFACPARQLLEVGFAHLALHQLALRIDHHRERQAALRVAQLADQFGTVEPGQPDRKSDLDAAQKLADGRWAVDRQTTCQPRGPNSRWKRSISGISRMQGAHQVAQKLISSGLPRKSASTSSPPSGRSRRSAHSAARLSASDPCACGAGRCSHHPRPAPDTPAPIATISWRRLVRLGCVSSLMRAHSLGRSNDAAQRHRRANCGRGHRA